MDLSEVEDDPEPYESSADDWSESEKKKTTRRTSKRTAKKPRKSLEISESSDSEKEKKSKPKNKNGINKKRKISSSKTQSTPSTADPKQAAEDKVANSKNYSVGSFVISKKEAKVGDPKKHPLIWRIDGKSLLQKYEPFEHEGKIRHKNTSVYTGWSPLDLDEYAPVTIDLIEQNPGQVIVELHWDELKLIVREDSD